MSPPRTNFDSSPVRPGNDWHVSYVNETGSTNADLLAAAAVGAPDRSVLVADHQTAGRGRLDRTWDAPPGANLLVSVLFRTGFDPMNPHALMQIVALAAASTAERLTTTVLELKWPNDLLVGGAKLAGILAQASVTGADHAVIVGIGLNLGWAPPGAARLKGVSRDAFLNGLLEEMSALLGHDPFDEYRRRLSTLGRHVRVECLAEIIEGRAVDVRREGSLVLDTSEGRRVVSVGDVIHLRTHVSDHPA
jgi:BirA family transcriptional regulator, biotin operon repressor / biotin---[acetyl-CoA-carboxylase] ligase